MRPTTWPALLLILVLSACATGGGPDAANTAFTNSVGLRMVRIPAGEFLMGSDEPAETLHKSYPLA